MEGLLCRRETELERRYDKDRRAESPSKKRRKERDDDIAIREAGEIPEGRYRGRDGHSRHHSREAHRYKQLLSALHEVLGFPLCSWSFSMFHMHVDFWRNAEDKVIMAVLACHSCRHELLVSPTPEWCDCYYLLQVEFEIKRQRGCGQRGSQATNRRRVKVARREKRSRQPRANAGSRPFDRHPGRAAPGCSRLEATEGRRGGRCRRPSKESRACWAGEQSLHSSHNPSFNPMYVSLWVFISAVHSFAGRPLSMSLSLKLSLQTQESFSHKSQMKKSP